MFTVIIPAWQGHTCWQRLLDSSFMQRHELLLAGEHGFCEGAQHNRARCFRTSSTETSVFFLQSTAARTKWPVTDAKVQALRAAFAPKQNAEAGAAIPADCNAAAGRDMLMAGDFNHVPAGHKPVQHANPSHAAARNKKERHGAVAHCTHVPGQDIQTPGTAYLGAATLANEVAPGHRKKRRKDAQHCASHTGTFAPEGAAVSIMEQVLERRSQEDGEAVSTGGNGDDGGKTVGFAMSKSQRRAHRNKCKVKQGRAEHRKHVKQP
jgi:hypothetical protein